MRRFGVKKWLVVIGALVIVLSVGAVAWAATGDSAVQAGGTAAGTAPGLLRVLEDETSADPGCDDGGRRARLQEMKERRAERWERQTALLDALRDDMSAADQAAYDGLVASIEQQRQELLEARQALASNLRELHELVDKYLDVSGD